ncbi:MAG: hypothetical protein NZ899_02335 [Thermoguttaceae bacterium]|nr:hypothetical protein [Thermoguttaceae bacterium]MDW8079836.1 multiheme c-type cytochrome [Thermoguttaceae bacterium]
MGNKASQCVPVQTPALIELLLGLILTSGIWGGCGRPDAKQPEGDEPPVPRVAVEMGSPVPQTSPLVREEGPSSAGHRPEAQSTAVPDGTSREVRGADQVSRSSTQPAVGAAVPGRDAAPTQEGGMTRVDQPVRPNPLRADTDQPLSEPLRQAETKMPAASPPKRVGKGKGGPFDPIKENGPIFVGWPRPKFALVLTGREDGYLEPCGCAGLDRMKGGLSRRFSMFAQLRRDWNCPVVGLDVGGLIKGFGRQTELKFHLTIEAMRQMGYAAIALGVSELRLPAGELLAASTGQDGESLFVSCNVALFGFDQGFTPPFKIVDLGFTRLGVTAVLGDKWQEGLLNPDIHLAPAEQKLREVLPQLEKNADLLILLAHATREESWDLATKFPQFAVVVTAGTPPEPPAEPVQLPDGRLFIEVGTKGMNAIVLGFYDSGEPVRYQRVPLDSRFPQSEQVLLMLADYQEQLKQLGLEGLGLRPAPNPKLAEMGRYVGSRKCESCHEPSYEVWRKSGHAKAWRTLKELDIPRIHDPECISCHVIGWHPTEYFPYEGGFWSEEKTPHLVDVGCEACHGPGEKHIQAEMGSDTDAQEKFRRLVRVTLEDARQWQCVSCHDLDNSPDYQFDTYWPPIEHYED